MNRQQQILYLLLRKHFFTRNCILKTITKWHHDTVKVYLQGRQMKFEISDAGHGVCSVSVYDTIEKDIAEVAFGLLTDCNAYTM